MSDSAETTALVAWLRANIEAALRERDLALQEAAQLRAQAAESEATAQGWQGSANTFGWQLAQVQASGWLQLDSVMSADARARAKAQQTPKAEG